MARLYLGRRYPVGTSRHQGHQCILDWIDRVVGHVLHCVACFSLHISSVSSVERDSSSGCRIRRMTSSNDRTPPVDISASSTPLPRRIRCTTLQRELGLFEHAWASAVDHERHDSAGVGQQHSHTLRARAVQWPRPTARIEATYQDATHAG